MWHRPAIKRECHSTVLQTKDYWVDVLLLAALDVSNLEVSISRSLAAVDMIQYHGLLRQYLAGLKAAEKPNTGSHP